MQKVLITVGNEYLPNVIEEFITRVDMSDLEEAAMAVEECCGRYIDMHEDARHAICPDLDFEKYTEGIFFMVEEVNENEL